MIEIEQKYKVKSIQVLRRKLKMIGAERCGTVRETNALYDEKGRLRSQGKAFRIRLNKPGKSAIITFKGPVEKSRFKKRQEIEFNLDHKKAVLLARGLGLKQVMSYSKTRTTYRSGRSLITLDVLDNGSVYCEIEGSEKSIERISKSLGFTDHDREDRTYPQILGRNFR